MKILIDDSILKKLLFSPICSYCKHLDLSKTRSCTAFTQEYGIPMEIWDGSNNHTTSYPGDNGIMFERVPTATRGTDSYPLHEPKQDTPLMHSEPKEFNIPLCRCGQTLIPDSNPIISEKIKSIIKSKSVDILCPTCTVLCIKSAYPIMSHLQVRHYAEKYTQRHNYVSFKFSEPSIVSDLRSMASDIGGKFDDDILYLLDGSGCACLSLPLPNDHWLLQPGFDVPPIPFRLGNDHPLRKILENILRDVGKYAARASTCNGTNMDLDPDALVKNFIIGMIGYYTPTGLSIDHENNSS